MELRDMWEDHKEQKYKPNHEKRSRYDRLCKYLRIFFLGWTSVLSLCSFNDAEKKSKLGKKIQTILKAQLEGENRLLSTFSSQSKETLFSYTNGIPSGFDLLL